MAKSAVDPITAQWAKKWGIKVWRGNDERFYATEGDNLDSMQSGDTARAAFTAVMKTINKEDELPKAKNEEVSKEKKGKEMEETSKKKRASRGATTGVNSEIKRVIYQFPDANADEVLEILKDRGFESTRSSVMSIGSGFRNSMAVLREFGALKDPLPKVEDEEENGEEEKSERKYRRRSSERSHREAHA